MKKQQLMRVRLFALLFLTALLVMIAIIVVFYNFELSITKNQAIRSEDVRVNVVKDVILDDLKTVVSDISVLGSHWELSSYLEDPAHSHFEGLEEEFLAFSRAKPKYEQIRFIGNDGKEVIRVNNKGEGDPVLVPEAELQDKSHRYYVEAGLRLSRGEVYLSPLDLNIEEGKVELPYNPMIRVVLPVFGQTVRGGMVVLNYRAGDLLARVDQQYDRDGGYLIMINKDGHFLKDLNPYSEWQFMFNPSADTFQNVYSNLYREFFVNGRETYSDFFGVYAKEIISIEHDLLIDVSDQSSHEWTLISVNPAELVLLKPNELLRNLFVIALTVLFFISILILILVNAIARRLTVERQVVELNDMLSVINKILRHDLLGKFMNIKIALEEDEHYKKSEMLKSAHDFAQSGIGFVKKMKELELGTSSFAPLEPVDLRSVIEEVALGYDIPVSIRGGARVLADHALHSVFDNLMRNAVIHGKAKKITIRIDDNFREIVVTLADNGKGIPDKIRDRLFQEGISYGPTAGTGLGLYIVRKTMERYGGSVELLKTRKKGATFELVFKKA